MMKSLSCPARRCSRSGKLAARRDGFWKDLVVELFVDTSEKDLLLEHLRFAKTDLTKRFRKYMTVRSGFVTGN